MQAPAQCFTVYVCVPLSQEAAGALLAQLPGGALVVDYHHTTPWAELGLSPKSELEASVSTVWKQALQFLADHHIELRDLQRGKVCLSANEYTVMSLLPIINAYREMHPHIKIEVKRSLASRIPGEVLGRDVEIGVVSFKPTDTSLKAVPLVTDELALIVSPQHPLAKQQSVSIRELGLESFIAHNVPSPYRERVVRTFEKFKTPLNISMEMPTLEAIKRFVEQRAGVALMPRLAAQNEIATGRLSALPVREMLLERRLFLIYRNSAGLSHAARAFLKIAKKQHPLEDPAPPSTAPSSKEMSGTLQ